MFAYALTRRRGLNKIRTTIPHPANRPMVHFRHERFLRRLTLCVKSNPMGHNSSINTASLPKRCYGRQTLDLGDMAQPTKDNFPENLRRLMDDAGIDGSELARRVGRTPTTISRWRKGLKEPSFDDTDAIAKALGIPVTRLFQDPTEPDSIGIDIDTALRMIEAVVKKSKKH
jgi:ribosome-binding protein aMBF1 (putative translation factor)